MIAEKAVDGSDEHYAGLAEYATVSQLRTALRLAPRPDADPRAEPERSVTKITDDEFALWRVKLPHVDAAVFDAALQSHVTSRSLGSAFARSETALQLAWVLGAFVAVCLPAGQAGWQTVGFAVAAALPPLGLLLARRLPLDGEPQDLRRVTSRRWRGRRTP